jgi:hypothetical protein
MVLVILKTNVPIRKRKEMKKMIQIANKCTKARIPKINSSRKSFLQKNSTSSDEDEDNGSEIERVLFMAVEDSDEEGTEEEYEEAKVGYRE